MTQKIIISKAGYNILTETNVNNLIFSSDYNTLKYATTGTINVTGNYADYYHTVAAVPPFFPATYWNRAEATVAHGLGYTPYFSGYMEGTAFRAQTPIYFGDFIYSGYHSVYADSNYLYFTAVFNAEYSTGTYSFTYYYRIFKNNTGL